MKKQRTRLSKPRKIPQNKEHKLSDFVLSAGNIVGIEDDKYIRTRTGYIGILKVPGIDIVNFKKLDREIAQGAFGRALQSCGLAHKLVFVDYSPDYSSQIRFLRQRLRLVTLIIDSIARSIAVVLLCILSLFPDDDFIYINSSVCRINCQYMLVSHTNKGVML